MKVVKIAVPDCYGTYEKDNKHCQESECSAAYFCRYETANKEELTKQTHEYFSKPREVHRSIL